MVRIAAIAVVLLLAGCSTATFSQPAHVPSNRTSLVNAPSARGYDSPNSMPR